jgi:hypothetical protein
MATAKCPRCGDWTVVLLEDGREPEHAECECDGPHGCGYTWITNEPARPDLVLELERLQALVDELPPEFWPTWIWYFAIGRCYVGPSPCARDGLEAPCCRCGELTMFVGRYGAWICLSCALDSDDTRPEGEPDREMLRFYRERLGPASQRMAAGMRRLARRTGTP